jgi:hypothetical protein
MLCRYALSFGNSIYYFSFFLLALTWWQKHFIYRNNNSRIEKRSDEKVRERVRFSVKDTSYQLRKHLNTKNTNSHSSTRHLGVAYSINSRSWVLAMRSAMPSRSEEAISPQLCSCLHTLKRFFVFLEKNENSHWSRTPPSTKLHTHRKMCVAEEELFLQKLLGK